MSGNAYAEKFELKNCKYTGEGNPTYYLEITIDEKQNLVYVKKIDNKKLHVKVVIFNPYFPLENEYHAQETPTYSINYSLLHRNLH